MAGETNLDIRTAASDAAYAFINDPTKSAEPQSIFTSGKSIANMRAEIEALPLREAPVPSEEPVAWQEGYLPAVKINPPDTLPLGADHLVAEAFVHEGCAIALYGTNGKMIGWIDTYEWVKGRVYRDRLLASPDVAPVANDSAIDGWRPIVQRPTDHSQGWLKLADGSTFWGRWNRDHWERRTDALTMTAPIEARGGVEREGVEYPLNVFERLPNDVYPVAFRSAPVAPVAVSVKGLEWVETSPGIYYAWCGIGLMDCYTVVASADRVTWKFNGGDYQEPAAPTTKSGKAAAQSDFNARILSSIIPATKSGEDALQIENEQLRTERDALLKRINSPETEDWMAGVPLEAAHQIERHGAAHDAGKTAWDWFWLIGYLSQKAAASQTAGDLFKAKHHTISTAAALLNWHRHLTGENTAMRPGIDPVARGIEAAALAQDTDGVKPA